MRADGPFSDFLASLAPQTPLRSAITALTRAPEEDCVAALLPAATLPAKTVDRAQATARRLVEALRAKGTRGAVEGLVREYDLSSQEGVALMCLAEALLRIPDSATRDALIRDKISTGDWRRHVGHSPSLFVNAATWGLVITGKLTSTFDEAGLGAMLTRVIARGGEPLIRTGVDMAMRMMGEQFVTGQTIGEALGNARRLEAKGFRYSYDMLGEAATTAEDAARYHRAYEEAIHAIGKASARRGIYEGPGISIKLSALHPRYSRLQQGRVMAELLPRVQALAVLARSYDIGLNIDAEEAERLEISLDLLEALAFDPALAGWNGLGFVVQAYQKRAPAVLDWMIDLARRSERRLMIRLVKGAYWDSEIKRTQVEGLEGFPVYTRKVHTDVSYLACARKLLAAPGQVFPQFATHNAYTVAAILAMAGENYYAGQYEFQCLHGMGEPLYEEVVGPARLNRPCRIYAPVGTHETLLAYLVRRLLENGANSSFVNRIQDPSVSVEELAADPVAAVAATHPVGAPHARIRQPRDLFAPGRANSAGLDLTSESALGRLAEGLRQSLALTWQAAPAGVSGEAMAATSEPVVNPADHRDVLGRMVTATPEDIDRALAAAELAAPGWAATPVTARAACLATAADRMEARMPILIGLIVREAGKSFANAVAEVREAVDFLRYYAEEAAGGLTPAHVPLGPVTCISPWNFPLAIFTGQVAAALAAGNPVLAKPAEETPLIAAEAVRLLHEAGIPADVLHLLPGRGEVGARLVADPRTRGVLFTGSTEVARLIQRTLSHRLTPEGVPVPLIAETGGQNALIVDSSALAEQVVADVIASSFDSAGQRCSALRVLCLQEDVADRVLAMLKGALAELAVGNPDRLSTDIGPVISAEARDGIEAHVARMRAAGHAIHRAALPPATAHGTFVAPTIVEIPALSALGREVFGPVLHVVRYDRDGLDRLVDDINATGYGLTFGVHTRIDETIARVTERAGAGNIYVNRNLIGAVVGVQPFGGQGLSGTGPKAGGPLYLLRLLQRRPSPVSAAAPTPALMSDRAAATAGARLADHALAGWLPKALGPEAAAAIAARLAGLRFQADLELPGPVGERNLYETRARGAVLCVAARPDALLQQIGAALATGNRVVLRAGALAALPALPGELRARMRETDDLAGVAIDAALFQGDAADLAALSAALAAREGPLVAIHLAAEDGSYPLEWLLRERSVSINTTAAGGNAHLMMIG